MKVFAVVAVREVDAVEKVPMVVGAHEVDILKAKYGPEKIAVMPYDGIDFVEIDPEFEFDNLVMKHGAEKESKTAYVERVEPRRTFGEYLKQFEYIEPGEVAEAVEEPAKKPGRTKKAAE